MKTKQQDIDRFMQKVSIRDDGCWQWTGADDIGGYGRFSVGRKEWKAHRFSYCSFVGPIPIGLTLDHLCRNRWCVNPKHLEPVTLRVNLLRGDTFQSRNASKTHCDNGHEFTKNNTMMVNGWRQCRECILTRKEKVRRSKGMKIRGRYKTKWQEQTVLP
jgi:hypothetical protein